MNFWAVGSSFSGTDDKTEEFIKNSNWFDGKYANGDEVNESLLESIKVGDVLIMKSSSTKGKDHSITFTKLKAYGIVKEKKNINDFTIEWKQNQNFPLDFDGVSYRKLIAPLREDEIYFFIKKEVDKIKKNNSIDLLKYKKQIILQGPPGTGKTKLATEIAEEIISKNNKKSIKDKIEYFFKNHKLFKEDTLKKRPDIESELKLFRQKFPQDEIKDLSLEDYTLGQEDRDGFCYWLEYKLVHTGKYNGQARKFKIYYNQETDSYEKSKEFADKSDEETIKIVAERIQKVIDDPLKHGRNVKLGKGFVLKILNTYKPDEFFPINSETILDQFLNAIGKDIKGKNYIQKNQEVQNYFNSQKSKYKVDATNYEFMHYLFNYDVLNEDADNTLDYSKDDDYKIVQFHPSYTYEDFVRGISIETKHTNVEYTVKNRVLAELANTAAINPENDYVLIIDEINRANLSSVFGELIYALEYRGKKVESMYKLKDKGRELILPENLFIMGTMNTADRSVGHIDYAIRRRFAFVDLPPKDLSGDSSIEFDSQLFQDVQELFTTDNYKTKSELISDEFEPKHVALGHSYFIDKTAEGGSMDIRLEYEIKPILREYVKDGILKDSASDKIEDLKSNLNASS